MSIHFDSDNLTSSDLADLLEVTPQAVGKWAKEGMPHRYEGKDLRFSWRPCRTWWAENKHRGSSVSVKSSGIPSKAESEARLLEIRAKREANRLAQDEGHLVDAREVEDAWTRKILGARARLLTIPARLRGPMGQDVARRVEEEVHGALRELAKEWPDA